MIAVHDVLALRELLNELIRRPAPPRSSKCPRTHFCCWHVRRQHVTRLIFAGHEVGRGSYLGATLLKFGVGVGCRSSESGSLLAVACEQFASRSERRVLVHDQSRSWRPCWGIIHVMNFDRRLAMTPNRRSELSQPRVTIASVTPIDDVAVIAPPVWVSPRQCRSHSRRRSRTRRRNHFLDSALPPSGRRWRSPTPLDLGATRAT